MSKGESLSALHKAVFLDRDGTINEEKNYLHRIKDFAFIPGVPLAIRRLNQAGFLVIVVTNQSGVARGYFELADVQRLHDHVAGCLASEQAHVDGFFICPHHPEAGQGIWRKQCDCRKGGTGFALAGR